MEPQGVLILDEVCLFIVEGYFLYILCRNILYSTHGKTNRPFPCLLILAKVVTPQVRKTKLDRRIGWFIGLVSSLMAGQKPAGCYPLI